MPGTRSVFCGAYRRRLLPRRDLGPQGAGHATGFRIEDAQNALSTAVGGENVSTTIEGRERIPSMFATSVISAPTWMRSGGCWYTAGGDKQIPLSELATIRMLNGPAMIRNEDGLLTGYVYVDVAGRRPGDYVAQATAGAAEEASICPPATRVLWSGQYESCRTRTPAADAGGSRHIGHHPVPALLNTRSVVKTAIITLAVPFSAVGALWMVYLLGYNMSIAVWVGIIALLGIDAETGVFMLLYLDLAYEKAKRNMRA